MNNPTKPRPVVPNKKVKPLEFENRTEDLRIICSLSPNLSSSKGDYPDYLIISAPAGYGKTRLLCEVKNWFDRGWYKKGDYKEQYSGEWKCLIVNLADFPKGDLTTSCKEVALNLLQNLGGAATEDGLLGLEGVAASINRQNLNIFLMFDNVESNRDLAKWLNRDDWLLDLRRRVRRELKMRIVYAGRYISGDNLNLKRPLEANVRKLSPLEINVVARMVAEYSKRVSEVEWVDIVARTILFISGGVPKIIESIVQTLNSRSWNIGLKGKSLNDDDLQAMYRACQNDVSGVIEEILKDIQTPKLRNALETLCVFRRYEKTVISKLQTEIPEIVDDTIKYEFLGYLGKLVDSGLIQPPSATSNIYVYSDGPVLKLLRVKPFFEKRSDYRKLHKLAYKVYENLTHDKELDNPIDIQYLVERIYHFLMSCKPTKADLLKEMSACLVLCEPLTRDLREMFVSFLKEDKEIRYRLQELFGKGDINWVISNKLMIDSKDRLNNDFFVEPTDPRLGTEKLVRENNRNNTPKKDEASQTMNRKLRVFLCHATPDKPIVRTLYQRLVAKDWMEPWFDEEKLLPGQDWKLEIEKAVEEADVVITCLSSNSVTREGYVNKELSIALDVSDEKPEGMIFVLPLRLDNCKVPHRLKKWHYVDYFPQEHIPQALERIIQSLKERQKSLK